MTEKYINARGLQCPGPVVELFKVAKVSESGDIITIEVILTSILALMFDFIG
jgi:TusA-related sulfurtransferase